MTMSSTMFHTTPTHSPDYRSLRPTPPFRATPPRNPSYDSPMLMLTPSPLRRRVDCDLDHDSSMCFEPPDDPFPATPFKQPGALFKTPELHRSLLRSQDGEERMFVEIVSPSAVGSHFPHATKRKVNLLSSTPQSKVSLTPLRIQNVDSPSFPALAPLPAPRFFRKQSDPDTSLGRQAESLRRMRIADKSIDLDSDDDLKDVSGRTNPQPMDTSKDLEEVAEAVSPDGHVTKRRAKSRPVSLELMNSRSPTQATMRHRRQRSNGSNQAQASMKPPPFIESGNKREFDRIVSSATLFFGPSIIQPSSAPAAPVTPSHKSTCGSEPDPFNSKSANSSFTSAFPGPGDTSFSFSLTEGSPPSRVPSRTSSPRGHIPKKYKKPRDSGVALSDDEGEQKEPSFDFLRPDAHVYRASEGASYGAPETMHTRSSTSPSTSFSSSQSTLFEEGLVTPSFAHGKWPSAPETEEVDVDAFIVKTLTEGTKDALVGKRVPGTPQKRTKTKEFLGVAPQRPWASAVSSKTVHLPMFGEKMSAPQFDAKEKSTHNKPRKSCPSDMRFPSAESQPDSVKSTGAGSSSESESSPSNIRASTSRGRTYGDVGLGRPSHLSRLSAVDGRAQLLMRRSSSGAFSASSDISSEGSSAGTPTRVKGQDWHSGLPLKPQYTPSTNSLQLSPNLSPLVYSPTGPRQRTHSQLPISTKKPLTTSSVYNAQLPLRKGQFSTDGKTKSGQAPQRQQRDVRGVFWNHHLMPPPPARGEYEQPGRFEREFVEVDQIGAGEFGRAMKVRYKREYGHGDQVFAIKKSKRFEGARHRTRLREEVDTLKLLSSRGGHANILRYIDSWEQDEALFILTELCEYGNFAHFLAEYGHHFARLDEARVWKVMADLSNGLRFMHRAGVIHLDFKPANIFITQAGGFKIGDYGMATVWPRPVAAESNADQHEAFEREGDKMYLAAEVLQGHYGKETDIFSFGMTMLETAANIVVPTQGELWHKLRDEDFAPVDGFEEECSGVLVGVIKSMMKKDPGQRPDVEVIWGHPVVSRARARMEERLEAVRRIGDVKAETLFKASPLAGEASRFLDDILDAGAVGMDCT
ncbi:hypothetical protein BD410DRAFT_783928 [Rickenella mellea]|uniref:Protein kinase domain-containing protein n=1 Tax=Rickenella mellea TaxID=50990 RepID=A0A4Y7QE72_9AGAM|nr:hypothetical protein BD410DRAFT_783928 [Rickenella mellea]